MDNKFYLFIFITVSIILVLLSCPSSDGISSTFTTTTETVVDETTTTTYIIPDVPTNLTATALSSSSIRVNWNASTGTNTYYTLYKSITESGIYTDIVADGITQTSYEVTGLSANTTYYFKLTATNKSGTSSGQSLSCNARTYIVAVTSITEVPTSGQVGIPLILAGIVNPTDATNKTTIWSVVSGGTTGATITGNTLNTTAGGTVNVKATITNGISQGRDYTEDFNIIISSIMRIEYYWINDHGNLVTTNDGATSVVVGETLTITAQSTGYVVKQWHLNGINTGESENTYNFVSTTAGQYTVGLFVEKDGRLYNTNIIIMVTVI